MRHQTHDLGMKPVPVELSDYAVALCRAVGPKLAAKRAGVEPLTLLSIISGWAKKRSIDTAKANIYSRGRGQMIDGECLAP